jgi:hypothetical protein
MVIWEFLPLLKEKGCSIVQVYSDNTTAVYNINRKAASKRLVRDYCAIRRPDPRHMEGYKGNAWDLHWSTLRAWLHPPIPLITRVLRKCQEDRIERAMILVPNWKGQPWTPLLNNLSLRKKITGEAEKRLLVGSYMRKKELCLPPGDMALHLIGTRCLLRPQKEEWKPTNTIA